MTAPIIDLDSRRPALAASAADDAEQLLADSPTVRALAGAAALYLDACAAALDRAEPLYCDLVRECGGDDGLAMACIEAAGGDQ